MKGVLLDQGLPLQTAVILRAGGWDAVHVREIGMNQAEDRLIIEHAGRESRVAITLDRDFPQIIALTGARLPSVVLIRQQGLRAAGVAELLERIWADHESELMSGCVLTVGPNGSRIRSLPLG